VNALLDMLVLIVKRTLMSADLALAKTRQRVLMGWTNFCVNVWLDMTVIYAEKT
jgi:hypothetical protein